MFVSFIISKGGGKMTYEQRVEQFGDGLLKFASLLVEEDGQTEEIVADVLALQVPINEEPLEFYLQQMYAKHRPSKVSWLFQQKRSKRKQLEMITPKERQTTKSKAWIRKLQSYKIQERVALFLHYYMEYGEGHISEIMQTPINSIRRPLYAAMKQFEKQMESTELHYINETNFRKYFDMDFGSTYQSRRRLKQLQKVSEIKKHQPIKKRRQIPNWLPLALSAVVLLVVAFVPYKYHETKRMPHFDEKYLELSIAINSMYQPYRWELRNHNEDMIDFYVSMAAQMDYLQKVHKEDFSDMDERIAELYDMFKESLLHDEKSSEMYNAILKPYGVTTEEYIEMEAYTNAYHNAIYEKLSGENMFDMHEYTVAFMEKYANYIEKLKIKYNDDHVIEFLSDCQSFTVSFGPDQENSEFCTKPNGNVSYVTLGMAGEYFFDIILNIEDNLNVNFSPYYYHEFYHYLSTKDHLTLQEQQFMQYVQILAYSYDNLYPGLIKPVPPVQAEDLVF